MKIGILTSSRADYGIYRILLKLLSKDDRFDLTLIVFGMHLQPQHGNTLEFIKKDNFGVINEVQGMPNKDSIKDISAGYGQLIINFSNYWNLNKFDCVFALGDRFEMSAAVQSGIPFEVDFAHIHGGETTFGAVDNIYRHQISLASRIHFTSTDFFSERVANIIGDAKNIFNVGSLSLEKLDLNKLPSWDKVCKLFNIPNIPFVLVTFHPETIGLDQNIKFIEIIKNSLIFISKEIHIVITLANADASGSLYRDLAFTLKREKLNYFSIVANFGKDNYFSAMKNCQFLLGNTSSGIIEAASFKKNVINVGDRQKGRLRSENVIDVSFNEREIIDASFILINKEEFNGINLYKKENTSSQIINKILEMKTKRMINKEFTINENKTILDAIKELNFVTDVSRLILFVCSDTDKVIGSLTDGDIRRSLVKDKNLNKRLGDLCCREFIYRRDSDSFIDLHSIRKIGVKMLPLLNEKDELTKVLDLDKMKSILPLECMIMAGGRGKRLSPLTDSVPKPMLLLGDKPIIEHNIDRLISFGIRKFYISLKYLGEQIERYFGDGSDKGIEIEYIWEEIPLGTAGALSLVQNFKSDNVLLMNSDLLTNVNFEEMYLRLEDEKADMVIASKNYQVDVPYAVFEDSKNVISAFKEKPSYNFSSNAGIYMFKKELIAKIPKNKFFDITDLMNLLLDEGKTLVHDPIHGYWIDIGKPNDYKNAQEFVKHLGF